LGSHVGGCETKAETDEQGRCRRDLPEQPEAVDGVPPLLDVLSLFLGWERPFIFQPICTVKEEEDPKESFDRSAFQPHFVYGSHTSMLAFGRTHVYHQAQRMLKEETFILPVGGRQDKSSKAKKNL